MKFTLPISPDYVAHWGLWEAVREIYQNALDEAGDGCEASIQYRHHFIRISTTKGALSTDSLVLGKTSKAKDPTKRGKFGEGYKLALLVLARMEFETHVFTDSEHWAPKIERDAMFNSEVLNIYIEKYEKGHPIDDGVTFIIKNVTPEQWAEINKNIRPIVSESIILQEPEEKGRIYVGGLYVMTANAFQCGYSFLPGVIKLDRDRGMVSGFDLAWQTSELWTRKGGKRVHELLESEAPDVEYVESHAEETSKVVLSYGNYFRSSYGYSTIPVSSQEEIERAQSAGLKWKLIPQKAKAILSKAFRWFLPTTKSPLEQLREFKAKYEWNMNTEMNRELDEIIRSMSPQEQREEAEVSA